LLFTFGCSYFQHYHLYLEVNTQEQATVRVQIAVPVQTVLPVQPLKTAMSMEDYEAKVAKAEAERIEVL